MLKKFVKGILGTAALSVLLSAPGLSSDEEKAPFWHRNFAHRGLHTQDRLVPENSLPAFEAAASKGYGIELDVQLSKDGEVVVFHDDTLDRVCAVEARVDSKTLEELKALSLCGTEETIPTFKEVLDLVDGRGPLIVELKTTPNRKELCEKTLALLKEYKGQYCIESFDPFIVAWFRFHAPKILRGQLSARYELEGKKLTSRIILIMGQYCLFNALARPQFIAYKMGESPMNVQMAYRMGAMKIGWTSQEAGQEKDYDAVIFEFYQPEVKYD